MRSLAASAGFDSFDYTALPADLEARGPSLFVARARRAGASVASIVDSPGSFTRAQKVRKLTRSSVRPTSVRKGEQSS